MIAHIIGVLLAAVTASITGGYLAKNWSAPRLTPVKGALVGPIAAAPTDLLLQLLGGGLVGFNQFGMIDWTPVGTTMMAGALCGLIAVGAVGLIRLGSRRPFG